MEQNSEEVSFILLGRWLCPPKVNKWTVLTEIQATTETDEFWAIRHRHYRRILHIVANMKTIAITIDESLLERLDQLVTRRASRSRSGEIRQAAEEY